MDIDSYSWLMLLKAHSSVFSTWGKSKQYCQFTTNQIRTQFFFAQELHEGDQWPSETSTKVGGNLFSDDTTPSVKNAVATLSSHTFCILFHIFLSFSQGLTNGRVFPRTRGVLDTVRLFKSLPKVRWGRCGKCCGSKRSHGGGNTRDHERQASYSAEEAVHLVSTGIPR